MPTCTCGQSIKKAREETAGDGNGCQPVSLKAKPDFQASSSENRQAEDQGFHDPSYDFDNFNNF